MRKAFWLLLAWLALFSAPAVAQTTLTNVTCGSQATKLFEVVDQADATDPTAIITLGPGGPGRGVLFYVDITSFTGAAPSVRLALRSVTSGAVDASDDIALELTGHSGAGSYYQAFFTGTATDTHWGLGQTPRDLGALPGVFAAVFTVTGTITDLDMTAYCQKLY